MKHGWTVKALLAGTALAATMWTGTAQAEDQFAALEGIPAEAVSQSDMAAVEGKLVINLGNLLGPNTVVKLLEPGILLQITALGLNVGGPGGTTGGGSALGILNLGGLNLGLLNLGL